MFKLPIILILVCVGVLAQAQDHFGDWTDSQVGFGGFRYRSSGIIPTNDLKLLYYPAYTLGMAPANGSYYAPTLGSEYLVNPTFDDYLFEESVNTIRHYVLDTQSATADGYSWAGSNKVGTETTIFNIDFTVDSDSDGIPDGMAGSSGTTGTLGTDSRGPYCFFTAGTNLWVQALANLDSGKVYRIKLSYALVNNGTTYINAGPYENISTLTFDLTDYNYISQDWFYEPSGDKTYIYLYRGTDYGSVYVYEFSCTELPDSSLTPVGYAYRQTDAIEEEAITYPINESLTTDSDLDGLADGWVDGWAGGDVTYSVTSSGGQRVTANATQSYYLNSISTSGERDDVFETGKNYTVTVVARGYSGQGTLASIQFRQKTNSGSIVTLGNVDADSTVWTTYSGTCTGIYFDGSGYLWIGANYLVAGGWFEVKSVTVKEEMDNPFYNGADWWKFDGVNDRMAGKDLATTEIGTGDLTIEAWIMPSTTASGDYGIVSYYVDNNNRFYFKQVNNDLQVLGNISAVSTIDVTASDCITAQAWTHVAMVYDADVGIQFYVNGDTVTTTTTTFTASQDYDNAYQFHVGCYRAGTNYFPGYIAEVMVSQEAKDARTIAENYFYPRYWRHYQPSLLYINAVSARTTTGQVHVERKSDGTNLVAYNMPNVAAKSLRMTADWNRTSSNATQITLRPDADYFYSESRSSDLRATTTWYIKDAQAIGMFYAPVADRGVDIYSASYKEVTNPIAPSDTVEDLSVNENNGIMQGSMENNQPWHPYAFYLDGVDDYINATSAITTSDQKQYLFFCWAKVSEATKFRFMTQDEGGGSNRSFQYGTDASDQFNLVIFEQGTSDFFGRKYSVAIADDADWHLYSAYWNGEIGDSNVQLFIDGVRVDDTNYNTGTVTTLQSNAVALKIGSDFLVSPNYSQGAVGPTGIYEGTSLDPRSISEIIYNAFVGYYTDRGQY